MDMNLDEAKSKNILFKPRPIDIEEEINTNTNQTNQSFLNRSSMMTYSKM
jgi:hypothetical protein